MNNNTMPSSRVPNAAALILLTLLPVADAAAYVDPGTGSMILQVILGGFAALGVVLKLYWHRLTALFGRSSKAAAQSDADQGDNA